MSETKTDEDVVEVVLHPDYFEASDLNSNETITVPEPEIIEITCKSSPTVSLEVSKSIVQFTLPLSCSAKTKFFEVDSSITSFYKPEIIEDNAIRIQSYGFNVAEVQEKFKVKNPGTFQVIQKLEEETKQTKRLVELSKKQVQNYLENKENIDSAHDNISLFAQIQKGCIIVAGIVAAIVCCGLFCYCRRR